MPLISVITVCFNSEAYIEDTIKSVLDQAYRNYEYLIVDGGSVDRTLEIISSYESRFEGKLKWVSEPDNGIYEAMNKGIDLSTGELIGLINSDDWYSEDALYIVGKAYSQYAYLSENLIFTGNIEKVNLGKEKLYTMTVNSSSVAKAIKHTMPLNHPATFVTRATYEFIGKYNNEYKYSGDYDFFFRAIMSNETKLIVLPYTLAYMRVGGASDRLSNLWKQTTENFKLRKGKQSLIINLLYSGHHLLLVFIKQIFRRLVSQDLLRRYYNAKGKLPGFIRKVLKV